MGASECKEIVSSLKITQTDLKIVPVRLLIRMSKAASYPLPRTITLSSVTGVFPHSLKTTHVTPSFKKVDSFDPSNFRPTCSLSYIIMLILQEVSIFSSSQ